VEQLTSVKSQYPHASVSDLLQETGRNFFEKRIIEEESRQEVPRSLNELGSTNEANDLEKVRILYMNE